MLASGLLKAESQAECQHANAPPRQVPGRVVIVARIAPRLPSQHWRQCRHHQVEFTTAPFASLASTAFVWAFLHDHQVISTDHLFEFLVIIF